MIFSKDELLSFNEKLLGRGMPVQQDGIGYNKADYGACSTYYYGLSNAQLADLAKRLVKYCNTQLGVDKEKMKSTANELLDTANGSHRENGISLLIGEHNTNIYFKYNELFINCIKESGKCQWNNNEKCWYVDNKLLIDVLNALKHIGADVDNAMNYALENIETLDKKQEIMVKLVPNDNVALLKFDYSDEIVSEIKKIDKASRQWNAQFKFWAINLDCYNSLNENLSDVANFTLI